MCRTANRGGTGTGAWARTIILLDRSASMRATDAPGGETRLAAAKDKAIETVDAASRTNAMVAVIAFGARAHIVSPFTNNWRSLRRSISVIEPTDQPGDLAAALELAEAMIARPGAGEDGATSEPAGAVLIGDGGYGDSDGLVLPGAHIRFERVGPALDESEMTGTNNLGIVGMSVRRDALNTRMVHVFARVVNASGEPVSAPLTLTVDGKAQQRIAIAVPPHEGGLDAQGGVPVALDIEAPGGALIGLRIERPDALASDNSAHALLAAPAAPRIIHVTEGEPRQTGWILSIVLEEIAQAGYRQMDLQAYQQMASQGALPSEAVLVFDGAAPPALSAQHTISFGTPSRIDAVVPLEEEPGPTRALWWDRSHPIMRGVSLDGLYASRARAVAVDEDATAEVLATGRLGPLIVLGHEQGRGHLWIAFDLAQSNWPMDSGFVVFMANAIDALTNRGAGLAGRAFTTAEPIVVTPEPGAEAIVLTGPATMTQPVAHGSQGEVSLGLARLAGLYHARGAREDVVPVNLLSTTESLARTRATIDIGGQTLASGAQAAAPPREIWPWFIMAAAALLAIEWVLVAWRHRV